MKKETGRDIYTDGQTDRRTDATENITIQRRNYYWTAFTIDKLLGRIECMKCGILRSMICSMSVCQSVRLSVTRAGRLFLLIRQMAPLLAVITTLL